MSLDLTRSVADIVRLAAGQLPPGVSLDFVIAPLDDGWWVRACHYPSKTVARWCLDAQALMRARRRSDGEMVHEVVAAARGVIGMLGLDPPRFRIGTRSPKRLKRAA